MPIGAIIGGVATVAGAGIASSSASKSAKAATANATATNDANLQIFNQQRADLAPWRQSGEAALAEINRRLGLAPAVSTNTPKNTLLTNPGDYGFDDGALQQLTLGADGNVLNPTSGTNVLSSPSTSTSGAPDYNGFYTSPGYDFRMKEGTRAITASRAASGMAQSGDTLKALNRYGQDYASNEFNTQLSQLMLVAGIGQSATNSGNVLASNYGAQTAQTNQNATNALASSYGTQANAWGNALGTVGGIAAYNWG